MKTKSRDQVVKQPDETVQSIPHHKGFEEHIYVAQIPKYKSRFRFAFSYSQPFSLIVVMDLLNSFRDGNDLSLRQLDNISDAVLLVCRCTWAERTITTR